MAANALKKITTRAKQIFKKGGTWKGAIKKAGADYRAGKLGAVKKKSPKRRAAVKRVKRLHAAEGRAMRKLSGTLSAGGSNGIMGTRKRRRVSGTLSAGGSNGIMGLSGSQHISYAKEKISAAIGTLYEKIFKAKTKVAKRKLNKKLSALKSRYRKLC